ncbi:hypothetical protein TWF225_004784 [Orbilia oligospora]|uniref:Uncharacterized protein n=1 Tax=Orbilia oligospora TaxID=2813651 RepID=A0A8H2HP94_ORBOL|nr:hypothetical protein TWF225_004784 [Orbilia oligospora]KAF3260779.1 hypothetical protein TWF128_003398 [Orbilia oligospora]KAF3272723.1 hypothetical protein TWF217_000191 [Orbilia oligospora]KAF3292983.1 hypothetical protein TWF132_004992 [Orbilia oligospora]TGJ73604.1 hypothetical protein EYR41_000691 [Orbilia oligospora]
MMASIFRKFNTPLFRAAASSKFCHFNRATKKLIPHYRFNTTNSGPSTGENPQKEKDESKTVPPTHRRQLFWLGAFNSITPAVFILVCLELWAGWDDMRTLTRLGWRRVLKIVWDRCRRF